MSGFLGIVHTDRAPVDAGLLERLAKQLEFRGPDGTNLCALDGAGFCFTFFRTGPAPQCERQPATVDGNAWLLGEVRLDGRADLLALLAGHGERLREGASDEELVLRAWRLWGENAPERLMGDFAFAIWERDSRRLSCYRDVVGVRPFFFGWNGSQLAFSNTLDVLCGVPGLDLSLDEAWIGDFLLQGFSSYNERTVYNGLKRLPAGHALRFRDGQVRIERYTRLPVEDPLYYRNPDEYVEEFVSLTTEAVRERLPDGNIASFMSGGLDSTSVTAIAAELLGREAPKRLRAFTMDLSSAFKDEEPRYAREVADYLGIPLETIPLADERPYSAWSRPELRTPEPMHEPFHLGNVAMYRYLTQFASVGLSGYGGDDLLVGKLVPYARYEMKRGRLGEVALATMKYIWQSGKAPALGTGILGFLRQRVRKKGAVRLPEWIHPDFCEKQNLESRLTELNQPEPSPHPFHGPGYNSLNGGFWAALIDSEDAAITGHPWETRAPYLAVRLIRFLLRVPTVPWCMQKKLLRESLRGMLPESVLSRPKTPLPTDLGAAQAKRVGPSSDCDLILHSRISRYIDESEWRATLQRCEGLGLLTALRPCSLNYWSKTTENATLSEGRDRGS
jgi:asparagine synthase (glutamine-hydrolysing)